MRVAAVRGFAMPATRCFRVENFDLSRFESSQSIRYHALRNEENGNHRLTATPMARLVPISNRARPSAQTMAAPVGRSSRYEAYKPATLDRVATVHPMASCDLKAVAKIKFSSPCRIDQIQPAQQNEHAANLLEDHGTPGFFVPTQVVLYYFRERARQHDYPAMPQAIEQ